jgi:hypothetical protein
VQKIIGQGGGLQEVTLQYAGTRVVVRPCTDPMGRDLADYFVTDIRRAEDNLAKKEWDAVLYPAQLTQKGERFLSFLRPLFNWRMRKKGLVPGYVAMLEEPKGFTVYDIAKYVQYMDADVYRHQKWRALRRFLRLFANPNRLLLKELDNFFRLGRFERPTPLGVVLEQFVRELIVCQISSKLPQMVGERRHVLVYVPLNYGDDVVHGILRSHPELALRMDALFTS